MAMLASDSKLIPRNSGRGMSQPPELLLNAGISNTTMNPMKASASVESASGTPPSRSAGSATTTPMSIAAVAPTTTAGMNGQPWSNRMPAVRAPVTTNAVCARLTIPPMPVTIVNDRKISASARPRATCSCQMLLASVVV